MGGIDLEVLPGEVLAIGGESGSGKSTLLLCLSGIVSADTGQIRLGDRDLTDMSDDELTNLRLTHFGFVFQAGHLVPDLTAITNVAFPLMLQGKRRQDAEAAASLLLHELGISDVGERVPGDMSGGEGQRVAVARALITDPTVIFADEPTGSLDSRNASVVIEMLVRGVRERGSSLVLVTHSDRVSAVADREIIMRDGLISGAL